MTKLNAIKIVFERAEGRVEECTKHVFEGPTCWEDVEAHIRKARMTAPATGGYDKCDVEITYEKDATGDQLTYSLRYDMQHPDRSGYGDTLAKHVASSWLFYSMRETPSHLTREQHVRVLKNIGADTAEWSRLIDTYAVPGLA
jgi:hypothetical protein